MSEDQRTMVQRILDTVNRTGYDREFREKFLENPRNGFKEEGVDVPEDVEIIILPDDPKKLHVVLPDFDDSPEEINPSHPLWNYLDK